MFLSRRLHIHLLWAEPIFKFVWAVQKYDEKENKSRRDANVFPSLATPQRINPFQFTEKKKT